MPQKLKDIAVISAGYSFRGSVPVDANGSYRVIQIKDVDSNGFISIDGLARINLKRIKRQYLTATGDVLFASRGTNHRAATVDEDSANAVFVSQLYALKAKDGIVIPEYLTWYLNQPATQTFLTANSTGSHTRHIRLDALGELAIAVPPLETQRRIVRIHDLSVREKQLAQKILIKRQQIVEQKLLSIVAQAESALENPI